MENLWGFKVATDTPFFVSKQDKKRNKLNRSSVMLRD